MRQALGKLVVRGLVEKRPNPNRRRTIPEYAGRRHLALPAHGSGGRVAAGLKTGENPHARAAGVSGAPRRQERLQAAEPLFPDPLAYAPSHTNFVTKAAREKRERTRSSAAASACYSDLAQQAIQNTDTALKSLALLSPARIFAAPPL